MSYKYAEKEFNLKNLIQFIASRVLRIVPMYYLALLIYYFIFNYYEIQNFNFSNNELIRSVLFIGAPYVMWTIPIEVKFYVLFIPFWYYYRKNKKILILLFLGFITPTIIFYLLTSEILKSFSYFSPFFFFGAIIPYLIKNNKIYKLLKKNTFNIINFNFYYSLFN